MEFKLVLDAKKIIAETPIWDPRIRRLYWTDLFTGDVHRFDPESGVDECFETPGGPIGSAIPSDDRNRLLLALDRGIGIYNLQDGQWSAAAELRPEGPENCFNDTRVDAGGRILASTTAKIYGKSGFDPGMTGNFYMIDRDGSVTVLVKDVVHYNGIVWNGDHTAMFVVDSFDEKLLSFSYSREKGPLGGPEIALDLKEYGNPDGISIDTEDNLYICHWTGKISLWNRRLKLKEVIPFPVPFVCCGGFGGRDMKDFFVSTATWDYTPEEQEKHPGSGGIFAARCEIAGRADYFYPL